MVTLAVPAFTSEMLCELLVPITTSAKLTLDGMTVSCDWVPVPVNEICVRDWEALLATDTIPVSLVSAVGANCSVMALDWPATSVNGKVWPVRLKTVPLTVI